MTGRLGSEVGGSGPSGGGGWSWGQEFLDGFGKGAGLYYGPLRGEGKGGMECVRRERL